MIQKKFRFQIILNTNLTIRSCSQHSCDLFDKDFSLLYLYFGEYVFLTKTFWKKTLQFLKRQLPKFVLAAALGPPTEPLWRLRIQNFWEFAAWEIEHLESCHWGNCHLGRRPWKKLNTNCLTCFWPNGNCSCFRSRNIFVYLRNKELTSLNSPVKKNELKIYFWYLAHNFIVVKSL